MKQTTYTCDWCKREIIDERADIKVGKQTFHMCASCHWDMPHPIIEKIPEYQELKNKARGEE